MGGGMGVGVKGGWRVNVFLFLLTASQAVLLPWAPLILHATGMKARMVGAMVAVVILASSVGVGMSLSALRRTHSGALRRLMLVMLLAGSTILQMSSVALLPLGSGENYPSCGAAQGELSHFFNNASSSAKPVQIAPGSVSLSTDDSLDVTTMAGMTTPRPTTTSSTSIPDETTVSHNLPSIGTNKPNQTTQSQTPTQSAALTSTSDTKQTNNSIPLPFQNVSTPSSSSHSSDNIAESHVSSTTPGSKDHGTQDDTGGTTEKQEEALSNAPTTIIQGVGVSPEIDSPPNTTLEQNEHAENDGSSEEEADEEHVDKNVKIQHKDEHKSNGKKHHGHRNLEPTKQLQDYYDRISDNGFHDEYDDYYYDNKDNLESHENPRLGLTGSQDHLQSLHSKVIQPFGSRNSYQISGGTPQRPNSYGNKKQDSIWSRLSLAADRTKGNEGDSINLLSPKQPELPYPPRIPAYGQSNSDEGGHAFMSYNSRTKNQKVNHPPYPDTKSLGSESYSEDFNYPFHKSNTQWSRLPTGRYRRAVKKDPKAKASPESKDRDIELDEDDPKISADPVVAVGELNSMSIKVGVTFLLVFGALLGSGVEAAVAQLWHCYAHGYDEGGVSQDVLQRTITHTFHLSVYATHNLWAKLTSGAWVLGAGVISIAACALGVGIGAFGGLAGMHLALGACAVLMVLVIPVPYGSVDPPKTRRPLSLYLDDEVLREGLRRMSFHVWVFVTGSLAALTLTYGLWLIQEITGAQGSPLAAQTGAVAVTLVSEGLSLHGQRWIMAHIGLQGTMSVCGLVLMLNFAIMWGSTGVGGMVVAHAGLGSCMALLWVSIKHNALLLATVGDQEREAWASWWCWRVGVGVGSAIWGLCVEGAGGSVRPLLMVATLLASIVAIVVGTVALFTRRHWRARRRVYHTLDLDMADEDDEDEAAEDDWLVRSARKEDWH
ncbi:uncharacterized protein LOC122265130 isoform X2 [Penaeus japonicus]|uniref:uncharacterized protein LOC122265130 isoform X2 n=1 Tax=Penaeus japonicus TaxID=27405 RepID=UPI001C70CD5E|nr:uncharacterized protein LOC122265130 isoform X2 [Penaeus japonicus]